MSSESATEREDSDEEILSFDLGPEPFDPYAQEHLPSDEWLDDLQQGLIPPGAESKIMEYDPGTHEMPDMPSLIDTMRQDMSPKVETHTAEPMSPERASTPTIGFSYDYTTDEPPTIQKMGEAPTHSSPHPDPPQLRARPSPALRAPRPRSTSVPQTTVKKPATRYLPVTENVTPTVSPARVAETDQATPSPIYHPGKGRGRGRWCTQETQDVGASTKTKPAESQATQAQASRASWPNKRDDSLQITHLARDLQLRDIVINRTFSSSHPRAPVVAQWGFQPQ